MTSEQLEASRAERMRQNGHGPLTLEDARTWIEETGLCLFLPRRQFAASVAPSFVEAVAGQNDATPDPRHIAVAEELLVRLELDGVAVRLNLLGQPGEQPDFVVASWVLPYVYALRGDRDWRRSPQLTGSRQVSQLAIQAYKLLENGDATVASLKHALGREVTETAVLRAITELWQQLRIIPVVAAPGEAARWQLLRHRFQKAIAEGASTSQVTAISVLASIYLQAVIAASMEEVEVFLSSLTARSKVREVLRGLVATRQVHTISLGHAPHFYVAGTLPEFSVAPTLYASGSFLSSSYSYAQRTHDHEEEDLAEPVASNPDKVSSSAPAPHKSAEKHTPRTPAARKPAAQSKSSADRPHFSRPASRTRDRKPGQSSSGSRPARRTGTDARPASARSAGSSRPASGPRWSAKPAAGSNGAGNGAHGAPPKRTGSPANGNGRSAARPANGTAARSTKTAAPAWGKRNGHSSNGKPAGKTGGTARPGSTLSRGKSAPHAEGRTTRGPAGRKPALAAGAKAGASKRYGFAARPKPGAKKRG